MILITDTADFAGYLPQTLNECSLLTLMQCQELKAKEDLTTAEFAIGWMKACLTQQDFDTLLRNIEPMKLAEMAVDASDIFLGSKAGLTEQKLPLLPLKGLNLFGPKTHCSNICFGQWIEADEQFLLWHKSKELKCLAKLVAILYRPEKEKLYDNSLNAENASRILNTLDQRLMHIVADFWAGCRGLFEKRFDLVFPKVDKQANTKEIRFSEIQAMTLAYHEKMVQYAKSPERKMAIYLENAWTVFEFIQFDIKRYNELKSE